MKITFCLKFSVFAKHWLTDFGLNDWHEKELIDEIFAFNDICWCQQFKKVKEYTSTVANI